MIDGDTANGVPLNVKRRPTLTRSFRSRGGTDVFAAVGDGCLRLAQTVLHGAVEWVWLPSGGKKFADKSFEGDGGHNRHGAAEPGRLRVRRHGADRRRAGSADQD